MMETKKKTATITFHASHNYGSMLQAYALQQTLLSLGVDNEIINLRTDQQRKFYPHPLNDEKTLKQQIKRALLKPVFQSYDRGVLTKYEAFENFLNEYLILTPEYHTFENLKPLSDRYDYYITGSDQCWNTQCGDFDWSYYLQFTDSPNKISYSSSLGPINTDRDWNRIIDNLRSYKAISVREEGTAVEIQKHLDRDISILPDPTLLLSESQWKKIVPPKRIVDSPYIFLYTPAKKKGLLRLAVQASQMLGLPVVVSNITDPVGESIIMLLGNCKFEYVLDVGPREFLNLIFNAELVLSGSFHAIIFSIMFHRPFFAFEGLGDNRMKHLLDSFGFINRAINLHDSGTKLKMIGNIDFSRSENVISQQKSDAIDFLKSALDIE